MDVSITALYAGLSGLMVIALAWLVVRQRRTKRVGVGTGGDARLERAIRAHGNFAEYVPLALLLLLVAEIGGASATWLHANGASLVVARCLHAFGLSRGSGVSFGRFWGTAITWLVILFLALGNLWAGAKHLLLS